MHVSAVIRSDCCTLAALSPKVSLLFSADKSLSSVELVSVIPESWKANPVIVAEQRVTNSQSYYYFAPVEFAFFLPLHLDLQHPGVGSARKCLSDPRIPFICGPRESEGPESKNGGDALDVDILCSVCDKV